MCLNHLLGELLDLGILRARGRQLVYGNLFLVADQQDCRQGAIVDLRSGMSRVIGSTSYIVARLLSAVLAILLTGSVRVLRVVLPVEIVCFVRGCNISGRVFSFWRRLSRRQVRGGQRRGARANQAKATDPRAVHDRLPS
jgi:hypothetical protein